MNIHAMRQKISQAVAHEEVTGNLARTLAQVAMMHGTVASPDEIGRTVAFVKSYIENVPDLIERCAVAAERIGAENQIIPILQAAEHYFFAPFDVIADQLGLVGLLDDAYYAQSLLQMISSTLEERSGLSLIGEDLTQANALARQLIGEPQATMLDTGIAQALQQATVRSAYQGLRGLQGGALAPKLPSRPRTLEDFVREAREAVNLPESDVPETPNPLRGVSTEAGSAADSEDSWEQAGHRMLLNEFQKRIQTGEISPERARTLKPILEELGQVIGENPEEIQDIMSHVDRFRELMGRMTNLVVVPSDKIPAPKEGSRGAYVNHLLQDAKRFLMIEGRRPHMGDKEGEMALRLFERCALLRNEIHSAGEDEHQTLKIERESARKLAMDISTYGLRHHLMLADPIWPSPSVDQDPNAVFFSGGEKIREAVASACVQRGMDLLQGMEGHNYAQSRWNQLRRCNVAVFDFSAKSVSNEAEVAYEMGIALALGRSVVIAAPEQRKLPFDLDIEPVRFEDDIDATLIGDTIDKAAYGQQRGGADSSLDETVAYAEWRFGSGDRFVRLTLEMLKKASRDPIRGRTLLENILGFAGPESPILLRPSWPGSYPARDRRRCFHVMPFGQGWSNKVMSLAASVCKQHECEYCRGDKVADARIIRSIWDEICQASHVLVDLSGFNANVALELGMAHALGRNTLIMAQGETVEELFNSVAKVRVYPYDISDEIGFKKALTGFLR